MKFLTSLLFSLFLAISCFGGVNPVLQNTYTTNLQAKADTNVYSVALLAAKSVTYSNRFVSIFTNSDSFGNNWPTIASSGNYYSGVALQNGSLMRGSNLVIYTVGDNFNPSGAIRGGLDVYDLSFNTLLHVGTDGLATSTLSLTGVNGADVILQFYDSYLNDYESLSLSQNGFIFSQPVNAPAYYGNGIGLTNILASNIIGGSAMNGITNLVVNYSGNTTGRVSVLNNVANLSVGSPFPLPTIYPSTATNSITNLVVNYGGSFTGTVLIANNVATANVGVPYQTNSLDGSGFTNVQGNVVTRSNIMWGPSGLIPVTNIDLLCIASANFSISGTSLGKVGQISWATLTVSNSSTLVITSSWTGPGNKVGPLTTNLLVIPPGYQGFYSIWTRQGLRTNYITLSEQ